MNENGVMTLLSEANPVRLENVPQPEATLLDAIVARRRPSRRLVLSMAATAAVALAASLIGIFAFPGSHSQQLVRQRPTGQVESATPCCLPAVDHPLAPGAKQVSLSDAAAVLGAPIVLPDTALVGPAEAGPVWVADHTAAVTFPSRGMFIDYTSLPPSKNPRATYQAIAQQDPHSFKTIDLNGSTALAVRQNSDDTGHNFGGVIFVISGLEIRVFGHYDEATLQTVAQSIVRRAGASGTPVGVDLFPSFPRVRRIELGKASVTLRAPVVLPAPALVRPTDVGKVWAQGKCPHPTRRSWSCTVRVMFPKESLAIWYERPRPGWPRTRAQYQTEAKHDRASRFIELDGVPAWEVPQNVDHHNAGFVDFAVGGTRVIVAGYRDSAWLEAIARSIVRRSRAQ
jgi:hypothetical protein